MKKVKKWLSDLFSPENVQGLVLESLVEALSDPQTRDIWLKSVYNDLKEMNVEIDRALVSGMDYKIADLCARRKAYQQILESLLSAKRSTPSLSPNPQPKIGSINLDRVTA